VVGLYRGISVALTGVVAFKALHLGGYDSLKALWGLEGADSNLGYRMLVAQFVTTTAGTLCYPFDTVKRRLMMGMGQVIHWSTHS
jgi:solute carrier family 25 (mitochondrial adenine nucleotide translocator), member 4/5/6/31